ncbi:glycoside hydrolase family 130 protein [Enterococcus sp. BWT-B8]|uniref:BtaManbiosPhlase n=1 Tax=Enterococcus sp. BWT-B8 TaxID=2885157 RepID=UPI001E4E08A4|nr:glycoside hydrolase family 130 protein [Enterococcus sp. BWT-B8]MCB5952665.1 glycoside hydrolase family 130 protein [Enterococcus sp. BWT-B8]
MKIERFIENPLITPADVKPLHEGYEVIGAFNGGVAEYNGEVLLLLRVAERPISEDPNIIKAPVYDTGTKQMKIVEFDYNDPDYDFEDPRMIRKKDKLDSFIYLTSLSYIRIARSKDGHHFMIDDDAFLYPFNEYQSYGIEDARCTKIDDTYYINFSSVSPVGVCDSLVSTKDFKNYQDLGNIFAPENKDVLIFPEKINDNYYALHRPSLKSIGNYDIWIASSPDLVSWGNHKHLLGIRKTEWDSGRIGGGLVPVKTKAGWLVIYHGATSEHRYCMGAVLLDLNDPTKVIARSQKPIMEPEAEYEKNGFFGDVVFGCGGIVDEDRLTMYYGVADTSMAGCTLSISEIIQQAKEG